MEHIPFNEYSERFKHVVMTRDDAGVLELRLHTDGDSMIWGDGPHSELGTCFEFVGQDRENRVVIITGTGDRFCTRLDTSWVRPVTPEFWDRIYFNGKRLLNNLMAIEVPVIAAINGPAHVHAEIPILSDVVLAADTVDFADTAHFRLGSVPGDGVHVIWPALLGLNRGRYFLVTGQRISAQQALDLGIVSEVVAAEDLMPRARELAAIIAKHEDTTLRYTRVALTHTIRKLLFDNVGPGLAVEGLNAYKTWYRGDA